MTTESEVDLSKPKAEGAPAAQGATVVGETTVQVAGKTVVLPTHAFARLKKEEREKGKKAALQELATSLGFSSVEEFTLSAGKLKAGQSSGSGQKTQAAPDRRPDNTSNRVQARDSGGKPSGRPDAKFMERFEKEKQRLEKDKADLAQRMRREVRGRRDEQQRGDALEAQMELQKQAMLVGVKDVDYAMRLLTRHLDGKSEKELSSFDETKFFEGLRDSNPYLFGETVRPATTGTGVRNPPPAPRPGEVTQVSAQGNQLDARKLSQDDYRKLLVARGLNAAM